MAWALQWSGRALKDLARLDRHIRERIVTAVERLADTGEGGARRRRRAGQPRPEPERSDGFGEALSSWCNCVPDICLGGI